MNESTQSHPAPPTAQSSVPPGHLGKADTDAYKGVGILLIVLHNYFHWVSPSPGENEFDFQRDRTLLLLSELHAQPSESVNLLFSYFGHYGVQLFVFLSAYGLTRAYGGRPIGWVSFMWHRAVKIYPTFVLAVIAHALFVISPWSENFVWFLKVYALKLSLLSAVYPRMQLSPVGPWWFFSMIFQFYAMFHVLDWVATRFGRRGLAAVGVLALAATPAANAILIPKGLNLYYTVFGHLPVLCLGIGLARSRSLRVDPRLAIGAGAVFLLGAWYKPFWYLAPVSVTLLLLAALPWCVRRLRGWDIPYRFVEFCGAISLPLFAIHGMMRGPFVQFANDQDAWYVTLGCAAVFLAAALAAALVLRSVENAGHRWVFNPIAAKFATRGPS